MLAERISKLLSPVSLQADMVPTLLPQLVSVLGKIKVALVYATKAKRAMNFILSGFLKTAVSGENAEEA